ncbi:hypothetical protein AS189_16765 [Arthrobacter alpinus]|uniref:TIGR03089 family protein n=1 Tax=Arthrobacter alpinus TaxID=656366 RepID=A0A0S2M326_9MICC|nr:TIGR03089 family protein [Arthrobacter alpinus]ALO67831.1 hypothetical protein AS189_16765 [Arthrobacter alpinus]
MTKWAAMDQSLNTPTQLLHALRTNNPTSPRLTWYGPDSERVEFSGRVLENWVAKTANYLVDELDAETGTVIALDLPLHWRSLAWLLATWAVGATAATTSGIQTGTADDTATSTPAGAAAPGALITGVELFSGADIVATASPAQIHSLLTGAKSDPLVVAVALPALQMRWMGELPPRTLDYSGEVRSHADVFFADAEPEPSDTAWQHTVLNNHTGAGTVVAGPTLGADTDKTDYAHLLTGGAQLLSIPGTELPALPQRVLLQASHGWAAVVPDALKIWAAGGSVVLLGDGVLVSETLRASENITLG